MDGGGRDLVAHVSKTGESRRCGDESGQVFCWVVIVVINPPTSMYIHYCLSSNDIFFWWRRFSYCITVSRTLVTYVDPVKDLTRDRFLVTVLEKLISSERIFAKKMTWTRGSDVQNPAPT